MKKFFKFGAVLTALVLGLACFVACSDGGNSNDGGGSSNTGGNVSNNGGGNTNNGGGSSNNDEEVVVKPKVTVVATWKSEDNVNTYKFYSDGTYELLERASVITKGTYYGISSPRQQGDLTMSQEYASDKNSGTLIKNPVIYGLSINKKNGELCLVDGYRDYSLVD